jgi:transcription elongation factor GreA
MSERPSAAALLRSVGLLPDGPVLWGRPLPGATAGVVVVELPEPADAAPLEPARVGKWLERVPSLRLDGAVPTTRGLVARLAGYWIPGQTVVFVGFATSELGRRVVALARSELGVRSPLGDGHWLLALRRPEALRVWWAETDAAEEYADALLDAFAAAVPPEVAAALPEPGLVLPWATLRRPTGETRRHGLTDDLLEPVPRRSTLAGDRPAPSPSRSGTAGSGAAGGRRSSRAATPTPTPRRRSAAAVRAASAPAPEPVHLSTAALERMQAELEHLRRVERPAVIARVRAARELGDLRENAEYQAAREEQSFLEGRIRALEERLRRAVVVDPSAGLDPAVGATTVGLGSTVVVEIDGRRERFVLVGPAEADPAAGRLSVRSPVGAALLGAAPGEERIVATPSGERRLRLLEVE